MKPRGVLIAGNWKMNHTVSETEGFFVTLNERAKAALEGPAWKALKAGSLGAIILPPMLSLARAAQLASEASFTVEVGAQNVHWEKKGAFTGEISGPMLTELDLHWALVGHSERRQYFGETDETVRKRAESLLAQGFNVILCIGETRIEREAGKTDSVLTRQIDGAFGVGVKSDPMGAAVSAGSNRTAQTSAGASSSSPASAYLDGRLVLAYEPVWAIGTGLTATPDQAEEAHALLRKLLTERFGADASARTSILYGGSVTPENIDSLLACENVDGALVGGASLKPENFLALLAGGGRAI